VSVFLSGDRVLSYTIVFTSKSSKLLKSPENTPARWFMPGVY
jgi:hypothetical protein